MSYVIGYGSATAAGDSTADLWRVFESDTPVPHAESFLFANRPNQTIQNLLTQKLARALTEAGPPPAQCFGVILASTKGISADFIYNDKAPLDRDPLTPLLENVLQACHLKPQRALCISNACSSGLAALRLAQMWLAQDLDEVLIFAADAVTDFVTRGFSALQVLSDRDGFRLGDGAAVVRLARQPRAAAIRVRPVGLDSDGSVVTKVESAVPSLIRALERISDLQTPEFIFRHGTGTAINEETEAQVFDRLFPQVRKCSSKGLIGHTLGASSLLDVILACEWLKRANGDRALVASLGFGGMHAVALLEAYERLA